MIKRVDPTVSSVGPELPISDLPLVVWHEREGLQGEVWCLWTFPERQQGEAALGSLRGRPGGDGSAGVFLAVELPVASSGSFLRCGQHPASHRKCVPPPSALGGNY